jgi:hypothetical protein
MKMLMDIHNNSSENQTVFNNDILFLKGEIS